MDLECIQKENTFNVDIVIIYLKEPALIANNVKKKNIGKKSWKTHNNLAILKH